MKIVITDHARNDLLRIYRYLAGRNPRAADAIVERMTVKFGSSDTFHLSVDNAQAWHQVCEASSPACT
jgi:plasmid stabilization system protein ParE